MGHLSRFVVIGALGAVAVPVTGDIVNLAGVPDLSQHANMGWQNYCAPTAGTDVAYYFSQLYSALNQGDMLPGTTSVADGIIAGAAAPPPGVGSMADRMGTTTTGGTTALNLRDGLDSYMEDIWDLSLGGADWDTILYEGSSLTGAGLWSQLQTEMHAGSGVVLLIAWLGMAPESYDVPDMYMPGTGSGDALGHAVTMTGFDTDAVSPTLSINDPANNAVGIHAFGGEGAAYAVGINASDISITLGGQTATIYGAVVTNLVPAPGALALLAIAGVCGRSRRRR